MKKALNIAGIIGIFIMAGIVVYLLTENLKAKKALSGAAIEATDTMKVAA